MRSVYLIINKQRLLQNQHQRSIRFYQFRKLLNNALIVNVNNSSNKKLLIRVFTYLLQISSLNSNVVDFILNELSKIFHLIDVDVVESSI